MMQDHRQFWVDRRGWVFDHGQKSVKHPIVDEVMDAIRAWELR
jgi:hypothetical protein